MKFFPTILTFLIGVVVTSIVWGIFLVHCQIEMAMHCLTRADIEARNSQRILSYMDNPNSDIAQRVMLSASNHIVLFSTEVEEWDKRYPYLDIKRRFASTCKEFQIYLQSRQVDHITNATRTNTPPISRDSYFQQFPASIR